MLCEIVARDLPFLRGIMPISLACEFCGRTVQLRPYRAKTFRFCSRSCLAKAMLPEIQIPRLQAITGKPAHNNAGLTRPCKQCGNQFALPPSRTASKHYCSQDCYSLAQRVALQRGQYRRITTPDGRRMHEHRYLMEIAIGRPLLITEQVHHINHDTLDNRLENLTILDIREHARVGNRWRYHKC
jgi:HNH endonuclease